jgi:dihydrofolate synthase/folylpolyglutamate synthase
LYTSPHLQEFSDRIRVLTPDDGDGRISEGEVVSAVETIQQIVDQVPGITWFELITAMAFLHFARQEVDIAVVEVGLGGRLDATNIITPLVSVITSISYDHTYLLGDTLAEIAGEKAAIIKEGVPVVSASQAPEALAQIEEAARQQGASLAVIGRQWMYQAEAAEEDILPGKVSQRIRVVPPANSVLVPAPDYFQLSLAGRHQQENAVVALAALEAVEKRFPRLTLAVVQEGLATVSCPGRLQMLSQYSGKPAILVDCAHNVDSAEKLAHALQNDYRYDRLWLILGVTADKDVAGIIRTLVPLAEGTVMTTSGHPRATAPEELMKLAVELGYEGQPAENVAEAVRMVWQWAAAGDLICVTGSIFVVGDLLNQWDALQSEVGLGNIP